MGLDAQLTEHLQYRGEHLAVALQLDNHQIAHIQLSVALQVAEAQTAVDGQALRLALVDQRDAREVVVQRRLQGVDTIAEVLAQKEALLRIFQIHVAHLNALLLGAPVVVLRLDLHELQATDAIGTEAYLLTVGMSPLVLVVHVKLCGVEVRGVVLQITLAVYLLHVVVLLGQQEKLSQLLRVGHKLGVRAVHQLHTAHLFECDGDKCIKDTSHRLFSFVVHLSTAARLTATARLTAATA